MVKFGPSGAATIGREGTVPAAGRHPADLTGPGCCLVPVHNAHNHSVFQATWLSPAPGVSVTGCVALGVPQPRSCDGLNRASAHPPDMRVCVSPHPQHLRMRLI